LTAILVALVTGCSWEVTARLTPAGETTLRNRRTEWLKAGVFNKLVEESTAGYDKIIGPRANAASSTLLPSTASSLIWSL
jgi:transposase